jgi:Spy/CpxP family protein refolding chaperone
MIGYMAALFIAGAITGAAVVARTAAGSQTLKIGRAEEIAGMIQQRLLPLNLTHEQREKFAPLIKQTSEELEASHLQCLQRSSTAVDCLYAQIRTNLNSDQLEAFNQLEAQRRESMRKKYNYPPAGTSARQP